MQATQKTVQPQPLQHAASSEVPSVPSQPLVRSFNGPKKKLRFSSQMLVIGVLVVLAGVGTGYLLSGGTNAATTTPAVVSESNKATGENEAGINDETTFTDDAEGVLKEGGIDGEGTHHLEREGGPSKYVYLTSTVLNLDNYVGKKIQVWGQTTKGRKAGWLMDVGKIKLLE